MGQPSASQGAHVEIADVTKTFAKPTGEELVVLDRVSLEIRPGHFMALIGPSGCGKTTLLRLVSRLEPASAGEIRVYRAEPGGDDEERVGYVFQRPALLPWKTVRQNVLFGAQLAAGRDATEGRAARKDRADMLLELMGLGQFGDFYPRNISGGMQQRTNLARALIVNPGVLLLDEPFSALDAMTRERLQREVAVVLHKVKATVLHVTHDIQEAVYLADEVAIMGVNPGRIEQIVPVDIPRPRDEKFQLSTDLIDRARDIWQVLQEQQDSSGQG